MDPTILGAIIGLGGGLFGALLAGYFQHRTTQAQIAAKFDETTFQLNEASRNRMLDRKNDMLLDGISEIMALTNPSLKTVKFDRVMSLIRRCELVLDPRSDLEDGIRSALGNVGNAVVALMRRDPMIAARDAELASRQHEVDGIYEAHAMLADRWRRYLYAAEPGEEGDSSGQAAR